MEDYKKLYEEEKKKNEERLERARKVHQGEFVGEFHKENLEQIFPELAESEDERIRKEIISAIKWSINNGIFPSHIVPSIRTKDWISWIEKQGEHKSVDKVEPKFKVCDWVVIQETAYQITKVENLNVTLSLNGRECLFDIDVLKNAHLWTIQDAKDGDVLVAEIEEEPNDFIYIFKEYDQKFGFWSHCYLDAHVNKFHKGIYHNSCNVGVPATIEQRELLFSKMKEAGYEWNAEKKEVKKIEQKPAWSEEDEKLYTSALWHIKNSCGNGGKDSGEYEVYNWLKSLKDRVQPQPKQEWSEEDLKYYHKLEMFLDVEEHYSKIEKSSGYQKDVHDTLNWLTSLKDRVQPQPKQEWSDEDKRMYEGLIYDLSKIENNVSFPISPDVYKWLKSFKDKMFPQPKRWWSDEDGKNE